MFSFFAHPVYFYGLIAVLLAVSLVAVFSIGQEDKKARIIHENRLLESGLKVEELEKQLEDKDLAHKDAETRLNARIAELEAQLAGLGSSLTGKSEEAKQVVLARESLQKELSAVKSDLEKANKELSLSNEMYNGLKGQYDELEEKFSQLFEEFLKEQKKNQSVEKPQPQKQAPPAQQAIPRVLNLGAALRQESAEPGMSSE